MTGSVVTLVGVRGSAAFGGSVALGLRRGRLGLRGGVRALSAGGDDARPASTWTSVVADACVDLLEGGKVALAGCGRVDPGVVVGRASPNDATVAPWLSVGAGGRISSSVGRMRFEVEAIAVAPLLGDLGARATQPALVAVQGGAGASYGFE